jgi:short-subunit dehydrogenase
MKYIFVTGVSSGIGYETIRSLTVAGYHVIGTVRKETDAEKIRKEIADNCTILISDVQDIESCKNAVLSVKPVLEKYGLHCLINNAGIAVPGPLQYLSETEFENQMDVNVKSVRRITNILLPYLGTDKNYTPGKIINISSVSGLFNSPFNGAYCISKHALESMTDIYRRELSMFGITVSAIEPGPVKSEIWSKSKGSLDKFKDTEYGELLVNADKMIENAEKSALDVKVISNTILKILHSDRPKTRYLIHRKKFLFRLLADYLPDSIADRLVRRTLAKKDYYRPL